ncbi:FadR/GntR family transcriptional regulator [Anaerosphaera multitolerans]|uniref:FadR family transcriptional regulator n=1 Tax=Anaerosphaera multitolerans TaxID=2487351 RepID=A0A437S8N3_9FIRM|nr:FadR/GntR family transcriptional regulator [Anaerosphaera multitolerans]RVU55459.1 FadR family transcriptional regulator [Anaerosphaera multitolerans]
MSEFSKIKTKLLAEQVEEDIYNYIIKTDLNVGDKLPNEFELAEKFGVGRSTIREAVKLLESDGILEVRRGSGTYVVNKMPKDIDPLGLSAIEDKMALAMDLADLRILLEPGIAEMAALNATEEDIKVLYELCDIIEEKIAKDENYIEYDIKFHTYVAKSSKNMVVEQLIPIIDTAVMMFVNVTHKQLTEETMMTHRAVVDAIAERDIVGAKTAMMMHMTYNRNLIKKLMKESKNQ